MEELTAGQAAVLVRNEQDIDRSNEELEELEDTLNESIADSMRGARQRAAGAEPQKKKKRWGGGLPEAVPASWLTTGDLQIAAHLREERATCDTFHRTAGYKHRRCGPWSLLQWLVPGHDGLPSMMLHVLGMPHQLGGASCPGSNVGAYTPGLENGHKLSWLLSRSVHAQVCAPGTVSLPRLPLARTVEKSPCWGLCAWLVHFK